MDNIEVKILKSFIYNGTGGNGAGVVIIDKELSDREMQRISAMVGLSETAFVLKLDENNYDVRFFTPVSEVDLCGHATIAAFYYLGEYILDEKIDTTVYQNTKAGRLRVDISYKNGCVDNILMEQAKPEIFIGEIDDEACKEIASSLNIAVEKICLNSDEIVPESITANNKAIKPEIVSTGLRDIIIPVKNRKILNSIEPDLLQIKHISEVKNVTGYHVYTIEDGQVYARNFAPLCGINEECATGTSNGALGALLYKYGIKKGYFEVIQGEAMLQTSKICVNVADNHVFVGGKAMLADNREIENVKLS